MTHCLLCGTLNNKDFERCSLCKTEPRRALRVVTESRRWVNATLVVTVFLALVGALALDLYLANRALFPSELATLESSEESSGSMVGSTQDSVSTGARLIGGNRMTQFFSEFVLVSLWLLFSLGFVSGTLYAAKRATLSLCYRVVEQELKRKIARQEYVYPGLELAHALRFKRSSSGLGGTL